MYSPLILAIFSAAASAAVAYHNVNRRKYALMAFAGALAFLVIGFFMLPGGGSAPSAVQDLKGCGNTAIGSGNTGSVHTEVKC